MGRILAGRLATSSTGRHRFRLNRGTGWGVARAPYSYSLDVDGVHFALANIVDQAIDREVSGWLTDDLAAAASARLRFVFGHVPLFS